MESTKTMRALVVDAARGAFREAVLPRPEARAGEVLVKIHASGVNPLDLKIRAGEAPHARHALPAVLGLDLAGRVVSIGEGVTAFRPGDAVYGMTGGVGGLQGSLAEYAAVDARLLALMPSRLSMREAAGLPLVVITAWEGLIDRACVHIGQKVLVHGGAGGVGHIAVQLAKSLGAEVFATGRADQAESIRGYGATPIDFATVSVDEYVLEYTAGAGFDVIYDTVGGSTLDASFGAARGLRRTCRQLSRLGNAQAGAPVVPGGHIFRRVHAASTPDRTRPREPRPHPARSSSTRRRRKAASAPRFKAIQFRVRPGSSRAP